MRSSKNEVRPTQAAECCLAPGLREPTSSRRVGARLARRLFLVALLAGMVAAPGAPARGGAPRDTAPTVPADKGRVAEWQLFTAPDRAFSVRLPGVPKTSADASGANYLVRIGRFTTYVVFASSVGVFPIGTSGRVLPPMREILETTRDASLEPLREFGSHILWSRFSSVSGDSCITFLVEFAPEGFPRQRMLGRIILAVGAPRFLTIAYSAPADEFQEPKANDFLDSLSLLEGSR
jgi:hypothetical protein